jgi:hypothetical protein
VPPSVHVRKVSNLKTADQFYLLSFPLKNALGTLSIFEVPSFPAFIIFSLFVSSFQCSDFLLW